MNIRAVVLFLLSVTAAVVGMMTSFQVRALDCMVKPKNCHRYTGKQRYQQVNMGKYSQTGK